MLVKLLVVAAGGCVGAVTRYLLSAFVAARTSSSFPLGTLVVNALGCFAIGVVSGVLTERPFLGPHTKEFVAIGILGSLTTFSTFGSETIELMQANQMRPALLNIVVSITVGLAMVLLGRWLVKVIA